KCWLARKVAELGCKATSGGKVNPSSARAILTGSRDLALLAAKAQDHTAVWPNHVRAVGTLPVRLLMASVNSFTWGTPGWFQYHSITQLPMRELGSRASSVSSSIFAPAIWNRLSRPNWTICLRTLT